MERQISKLQIKLIIQDNEFLSFNIKNMHYRDRVLIQGLLWVEGTPVHNDIDQECCPDFSCCEPDIFIDSKKDRKRIFDNAINNWKK